MNTYNAKLVANKILSLADAVDKTVTPMQLIKLCYLCHGWMLGVYGRPLLDEHVQAWRYGPVVPSVYQATKKYRDNPVAACISNDTVDFDQQANDIIEQVYTKYCNFSGPALSSMTHENGSPWSTVWEAYGEVNKTISNDLIESHYSNLYRQSQTAA